MANSLSFRNRYTNTGSATSITLSSVDIGTANANRAVIVIGTIHSSDNADITTAELTCTIGGVSATALAGYAGNGITVQAWIATVTSGTSANVVFTHASRVLDSVDMMAYTYWPTSLTPVDTGAVTGDLATDFTIADIEVVSGGCVLLYRQSWYGFTNWAWSGPDAIVADYGAGGTVTSHHIISTENNATRDLTHGTGGQRAWLLAVSLPAGYSIPTTYTDTVTEGVGMAPTDAPLFRSFRTVTENFGIARYALYGNLLMEGVSEAIALQQALKLDYGYQLADQVNATEVVNFSISTTITQDVGIGSPVPSFAFRPGARVTERLGVADTHAAGMKFIGVLSDRSGLREVIGIGLPVRVTDTVGMQLVAVLARGVRVLEQLGLRDLIAPSARSGVQMLQGLGISDSLLRFVSGAVIEGVGVHDTVARDPRLVRTVTENVGVSETLAKKFLLRVTAAETVAIDDTQVLKMFFRPTLLDDVEVAAGYVSPNGTVTTWAINTKNFATTEYTNFEFNSFAQMGHKYIAASSTGLYELDGDTDAGAAIIADIKSGLMQLGGSRFSSFKAAYLGMRGDGDFVLKLETGDGKTYNYAVIGKDMQTTKVHLGKGLRARYFSFELISTGQDFDLDSVEFIPLVADRRV